MLMDGVRKEITGEEFREYLEALEEIVHTPPLASTIPNTTCGIWISRRPSNHCG